MTGEETFDLPVQYKGEEFMLPAVLWITGYAHKFKVIVDGREMLFEPDEENNYRARVNDHNTFKTDLDRNLLEAVTLSIENLFK